MKRKYYLRGLAVGVILTTIILTIANAGNRPMTDAQVRQRALELGMIESDSLKLTDVAVSSETKADEEISGKYNPSSALIAFGDEEDNLEAGNSEANRVENESLEVESGGAGSVATESIEPSDSFEPVIITIKNGDTSYSVSKALAAAGLVEDAAEYDNYLCGNGYSRKIRTGTYEIIPGMSYEEIAKVISR